MERNYASCQHEISKVRRLCGSDDHLLTRRDRGREGKGRGEMIREEEEDAWRKGRKKRMKGGRMRGTKGESEGAKKGENEGRRKET